MTAYRFEITHQSEDVCYDDPNGNLVEIKRGYGFRVVDQRGNVVVYTDDRFARRQSAVKVIRDLVAGLGGTFRDSMVVDCTDDKFPDDEE